MAIVVTVGKHFSAVVEGVTVNFQPTLTEDRKTMQGPFEPVIVSFCCQWCSYAAADLAGSMRLQYPPNIRIVKVPCTGRISVLFLLKALENGADGVFISGCLLGDCHYISGNRRAAKRVAYVKDLLRRIGISPDRVEMVFNSAAMAPQFAECCRSFTERIRELGPGLRSHRPSSSDGRSSANEGLQ